MPEINYEAWKFWIAVVVMLFNIAAWIWIFWDRKNRATNSRVENVEKKVEGVEKDIVEIKTLVNVLPNQKSIEDLNKNISELKGRFDGVNRAVDLINQHLINQGGKK